MVKVSKFGGSSVASSEQFKKVKEIVVSDKSRKFVVVSAAGKAHKEDNKITDLLYLCYAHIKYNINCENIYSIIRKRFIEIRNNLNINFDIEKELDKLEKELVKYIDEDYLVSRGEYLTALLMAEYLDYKFVDAKDLIFFNYNGSVNYEKTQNKFDEIIKNNSKLLIPGFYGSLPSGEIKIMSRGGGDVTGAIIANVSNAEVYENWTDVSGVLMADPRIVDNPKEIDLINYTELRELSYMGASVLHEEAIFPVKDKDIPIQILNTNNPTNKGTIIKNSKDETNNVITGIAGKKDFSIITIKKNHMSNEIGLISKTLIIFEEYNVSIEHIPSGIDSFSVIVATEDIKPFIHELIAKLKKITNADEITVMNEISLIATVGSQMKNKIGTSGRLFSALGKAGINVIVISQTSDEINIIVGVHNSDYEHTIRTIYSEFNK
ncbi:MULTISPECIES: aspartate kinase [unclassified Gemella]|uniref:aspartate kinase n=1 Tax=unclassified Gemella TaxID=2624949 RepID=UPI001C04B199|nr:MULTISPECIES: aspartate kinase [unclassified Gemella]MBU0279390.1 aspartate kinase [Gemella sp. zg-1178]QWQ39338.1 aspartate kinase [Gemella sp. zg-570]